VSLLKKFRTATRLVATGQFAIGVRQWRQNISARRLRREGSRPFVYRRHGFRAVCHPEWPDSTARFCDFETDAQEVELLRAWLEPGDVMVDVGANLGFYTFAAAHAVGTRGQVIAIDADPTIVDRMKLAATLLGATQIRPVHAAVTDRPGQLTFYVRRDGFGTGMQSLRPSNEERTASDEITVPALTLQHISDAHALAGKVRSIKLDIEGAEELACAGAPAELFSADGPLWVVEINPSTLGQFNTSARALTGRFPAAAFERFLLPQHPHDTSQAGIPRRLDDANEFIDAAYYNLIAIPRDHRWAGRRARLPQWLRRHLGSDASS
jgi:FkbM family methyltransferase